MKLIVVDDIEENRYLLETLLRANDYEVESASNGVDALEKARVSPPDLLISDILMPGMDGYSLCRAWKKDERLQQIPIIFYTATYTDPKDEEFALNLGAARFVVKPAEPEVFLMLVQEVLDEFIEGNLPKHSAIQQDETIYLKTYNHTLIRKLEDKLTQLQNTNHQMKSEIIRRKEKERESQRLTTAIEQMTEMVIITNAHGDIEYVNQAFEEINGFTCDEVRGQNPRILNSRQQSNDFYPRMWTTLKQGTPWAGRIINKRKDGILYTSDINITPIQNDQNEIINYVAVAKDVTSEIRKEELAQQTQKMESIGRISSGIAHDFNNILQTIMGFGSILESDLEKSISGQPADYTNLQHVQEILKASRLAKNLTRQVLTLSHKQNRNYQELNLNEVLHDYKQMITKALSNKVPLVFHLESPLKTIVADTSQLVQIALNLVMNAYDALSNGGKITVSTRAIHHGEEMIANLSYTPEDEFICLAVTDSGCGMTDTEATRLFEPFYTTKDTGTGLGLSLVYEIVQELKGSITVSSKLGEGTTFNVILPAYNPKVSGFLT